MSAHEQEKAKRAADSRPAFGARPIEARARLIVAQRQLDIARAALEDAARALHRREIGGAEWQVKRALQRLDGAQEEITAASAAVTIEDAEPFTPF